MMIERIKSFYISSIEKRRLVVHASAVESDPFWESRDGEVKKGEEKEYKVFESEDG